MKALPETNLEAVQLGQWRQWLLDPITKLFFAQLRHDQILLLRKASVNSLQTAVDNAKEHNKLVLAAAIEQIVEKYEHGNKYPFTLKLSESGIVSA